MNEILRFDAVSYAYETGQTALIDCSVSIHAGEKIAVLGKNGAGKSTFFLLANGVLKPCSGQILFEGKPIGNTPKALNTLRKGVGLVFQDPDVQILAGTVEEEISFGPMNLRLPKEEVRRRVDTSISRFALESFRTRAPQYLSGGEKKRVTLADVLAMEPKLLLLDEPAASLDCTNTRLLEQTLAMLSDKGLGLVVATHDMDFAWRWANRVLLFLDGILVADCPPREVFGNSALLQSCGLEQPTLYQVGELLNLNRIPRNLTEFKQEMNR